MFKKILTAIILSASISQVALADEVSESIQDADKAYQEGHYSLSLERLEQAMNLIKDVQAAKIVQFFPKPSEGWVFADADKGTAQLPNIQVGMFSTLIKRYEKKPETGLSISILSDKDAKKSAASKKQPWIQFTLLQKPNALIKMGYQGMFAMRTHNPEAEKLDLDGYEGVLYCNDKKPNCDVFFDFDGNFMLMVNSEKVTKEELKEYVLAFDAKGLISAN